MKNKYYLQAIRAAEIAYDWTRLYRDDDPSSRTYGGYKGGYLNGDKGIVESAAWGSGIAFGNAIALYLCKDSQYYHEDFMLKHAIENFADMEKNQNDDGTWDLRNSNYHDATAAAFTIEQIYGTYLLLSRNMDNPVLKDIHDRLTAVLRKAGEGILTGGFHTPNHRWVMTAALSYLYDAFKDEKYLKEAKLYLAEGIDIHEDGSFSEKSVGNYDAVIDMALMAISENFHMPELLDYVKRNLSLIAKMIQPDGTLYCYNSFRQDRFATINIAKCYRVFRKLALLTGDNRWLYTFHHLGGDHIEQLNQTGIEFDYLTYEMLDPIDEIPEETLIEKPRGAFYMSYLGLGRILGDDYAITVSCHNPGLLHFKKGKIDMFLSIAAPFFSRGQFKPDDMTLENGTYHMTKDVDYGYIRPFKEAPGTSEWKDMDHGTWANIRLFNTMGLYPDWKDIDSGKRENANIQHLSYALDVTPMEKGIRLDFNVDSCEGLPYKLDFSFVPGGRVFSEYVDMKTLPGLILFPKTGEYKYRFATDEITFKDTFALHHSDVMRGEEVLDPSRFHFALTGFASDKRSIEFTWN